MTLQTKLPGSLIETGSIPVSAIINFTGELSSSLPSGVVSSSTQVKSLLPDGTISSSAQINTYLDLDGVVSSSAQVTDQLDMLWHMMDDEVIPGKGSDWYNTILTVKNTHPKPE